MYAIQKCHKCGACCKGSFGPFVFPSDLQSISVSLAIEKSRFLSLYCIPCNIPNSEGLVIYSLKMIGGRCVFLSEMNLCEIYEYRPYQCKNAPFNFLAEYKFWKHMNCIKGEDFVGLDSSEWDKKIFEELITVGYV